MAAQTIFTGGVANLGVVGTVGSVAVGSLLNTVVVATSVGAGVVVGSAVDAVIQTFFVDNADTQEACPK